MGESTSRIVSSEGCMWVVGCVGWGLSLHAGRGGRACASPPAAV